MNHCGYCHPFSSTINPANCLCKWDCGFADCGYVGSGKPEYPGYDLPREVTHLITAEDFDNARRREVEFQAELREIIEEQDDARSKSR